MEEIIKVLPKEIKPVFQKLENKFKCMQEIRFRVNKPILLRISGLEYYLSLDGVTKKKEDALIFTTNQMQILMELMSAYSSYAFQEEIRQGFLTLPGGHRVGLCGKTIIEQGTLKTIQQIHSVNIRIAHEQKGCSNECLSFLYEKGQMKSTLIVSPPGCGKTTLLRDFIRRISDGNEYADGLTVAVIDERSEIAACYKGFPQNDVGIRTDVMDCCKKSLGMELVLRSMAPSVIAVDEIGGEEDVKALEMVMNCGCKMLATVHGSSFEDILGKKHLQTVLEDKVFERYIFLSKDKVGEVEGIYDEDYRCILDYRRLRGNGIV